MNRASLVPHSGRTIAPFLRCCGWRWGESLTDGLTDVWKAFAAMRDSAPHANVVVLLACPQTQIASGGWGSIGMVMAVGDWKYSVLDFVRYLSSIHDVYCLVECVNRR